MTEESAAAAEQAVEPSATPTPPEPSHPEDASSAVRNAMRQLEKELGEEEGYGASLFAEKDKAVEPEKAEPKPEAKAEPKAEAKAEAKAEDPADAPPRNPDGTFKAKEPDMEAKPVDAAKEPEKPPVEAKPEEKQEEDKGIAEAPARFAENAKEYWNKVPASVRAETVRIISDLESGIAEYQERWAPLKEFDELTRQHGTDIPTAMRQYIGFEQSIRRDPIAGLTQTCAELGLNFRAIVAEVSGQTPDDIASRHDTTVSAMQTSIAGLERQLGEVSTSITKQREDIHLRDVQAFSADNPRFEELSPVITTLLRGKTAGDLKEAYEMAERLNPASFPASPAAAQTRAQAPTNPAADQTRTASLSVTGAPATGSNSASQKLPASANEAVKSAMASIG